MPSLQDIFGQQTTPANSILGFPNENTVQSAPVSTQKTQQEQKGFLESIGDTGERLGNAFTSALVNAPDTVTNLLFGKPTDPFRRTIAGSAFESPSQFRQEQNLGLRPSALQTAADSARLGLQFGAALVTPANSAVGRIAQGTALGSLTGLASGISGFDSNKTWGQNLKTLVLPTLLGGAIGSGGSALIEGFFALPKLLSYTSDTPELALLHNYEFPKSTSVQVGKITPKGTLEQAQNAVRSVRADLTNQYDLGKEALIQEFSGKRILLNEKQIQALAKLQDQFPGLEVPANLKSISVNEALDFNKELGLLFKSKDIKEGSSGFLARKFKEEWSDITRKTFGGDGGLYDTFLSNYSEKVSALNAFDELSKAYFNNNPIKKASAETRLQTIFNNNKAAYLDALNDFAKASQTDLLDVIAKTPEGVSTLSTKPGIIESLKHKVAAQAVTPIIPAKSGKFSFDEILRIAAFPITSPRLVGMTTRTIGRLKNIADSLGFSGQLRQVLLTHLAGEAGKAISP